MTGFKKKKKSSQVPGAHTCNTQEAEIRKIKASLGK
jgi:hypothetical protein